MSKRMMAARRTRRAASVHQNRATVIRNYGEGYPDVSLDHVTHIFGVNELEEVHR